jgi:hypothetical protein
MGSMSASVYMYTDKQRENPLPNPSCGGSSHHLTVDITRRTWTPDLVLCLETCMSGYMIHQPLTRE